MLQPLKKLKWKFDPNALQPNPNLQKVLFLFANILSSFFSVCFAIFCNKGYWNLSRQLLSNIISKFMFFKQKNSWLYMYTYLQKRACMPFLFLICKYLCNIFAIRILKPF
jgi:hypothetical protein